MLMRVCLKSHLRGPFEVLNLFLKGAVAFLTAEEAKIAIQKAFLTSPVDRLIYDFGLLLWVDMGCVSSKERSVDGSGKRSLTVTNSRHELIISGLESNKFLPLIPKPKRASSRRRARAPGGDEIPLADVLRSLKGGGKLSLVNRSPARMKGGAQYVTDSSQTQPAAAAELQRHSNPPLQKLLLADDDDKERQSDGFSFFNPGLDIRQMIPSPGRCRKEKAQQAAGTYSKIQEHTHGEDLKSSVAIKDLKSVRVASAPSSQASGQDQSIYSPNTYVTPRFGSYALSAL